MPKAMTSAVLTIVVLIVLGGVASAQSDTPVQSFAALQPLIMADQEIIVWAEDGRKTRGKLVAIGGGTLEIRRPPRFPRIFGAQRREVFAESSVRRVDHRDSSKLGGGLIGFALGLAVSVTVVNSSQSDLDDLPVVALSPLVGTVIGAAIDGAMNRPLFISPTATKVVTAGPEFGRGRAVVSASFRF